MIGLSPTKQVHVVTDFHSLVSTPFHGAMNAICWKRELTGNFSEIVQQAESAENITVLEEAELRAMALSQQGQVARDILIHDLQLLKAHGADPVLNVIRSYERDHSYPFFPTDVYSFHVDRSPVPTDTFLCTYIGESSELLPNADVTQKICIPEIRVELRKLYHGPEEGFEAFLTEHFFDLHYQANPGAQPVSLGRGHIWRLAVDHPQRTVLPCVHRAPVEKTGESRLLLIC